MPQQKESVQNLDAADRLDEEIHGGLHIIYGGTKVMQHTGPEKKEDGLKPSDSGCLCYGLRTGFNTNQGSLLRTIMYGVKRLTANTWETFAFILFLLVSRLPLRGICGKKKVGYRINTQQTIFFQDRRKQGP